MNTVPVCLFVHIYHYQSGKNTMKSGWTLMSLVFVIVTVAKYSSIKAPALASYQLHQAIQDYLSTYCSKDNALHKSLSVCCSYFC